MDEIKELVSLVSRNKTKDIRTLNTQNRGDRVNDFYQRILDGNLKNDAEASDYYFKKEPSYPQYRKLKAKLKNRIYNTLFFIDVNNAKFNDAQKAYYSCFRNLMTIKIILGRFVQKPAVKLIHSTLKQSLKYEFTEISAELYRLLRTHHATYSSDIKLFRKYLKLADKFDEIFNAENLAVKYYQDAAILLSKLSVNKNEFNLKATKYLDDLKPLINQHDTYRLHLFYYFLALQLNTVNNEYLKIIALCDQALMFFDRKKHISDQFIGALHYNKLLAYIQLKDFYNGELEAKKCFEIFQSGTERWYNAYHFYFLMLVHSKKYQQSLRIRDIVTNHKTFAFQFEIRQETWKLYDAYLFYLYTIEKCKLPAKSTLSKFRIRKFLNEVPVFSMDKKGYNIPILIIHILLLIEEKKYEQLTDRMEAIEKYTTRYLKKDENFRSNCFIKMLLQIPKRGFHKVAVVRHAQRYYDKLVSVPLAIANQPYEVEIIPYEHLWEYVLESLDSKFH